MKTMRKMVLGASVGALALVAVSSINADAATVDKAKKLTGVLAGESVSFDAVKIKSGKAEYNPNAKWDLYEKASDVDLSNVKTSAKKDSYFATKSSAGAITIYKALADTQKSFKATCDGESITIEVDKKKVEGADIANFSWRTETSREWTAFSSSTALDLTPYTMQGATIYIRYMGLSTVSAAPATTPETIEVATNTPTATTVQEIKANSFAQKEFKVKVPKKANAPAISVDYVNGVIKANKKAVTKDGASVSAILSTAWSTSTMAENFSIDTSKDGAFMMQIPADTAKKKPASKTAVFTWKTVTTPQVSYTAPTVSGTTITNQSGDLITGKLTYKAVDNAKADKATFEIASKDADNTYEIFKAKTVDGKKVPDGKAVATIKAGNTKAVVLTAKKVPADTELIIRIAGDKKAAKLPSPFATTAVKPVYLQTPAAAN